MGIIGPEGVLMLPKGCRPFKQKSFLPTENWELLEYRVVLYPDFIQNITLSLVAP